MKKHVNVERFFRGRSHKAGDGASDPRESGATRRARHTIRKRRQLAADRVDQSDGCGEA